MTVAGTPSAYVPLDSALFTPVGTPLPGTSDRGQAVPDATPGPLTDAPPVHTTPTAVPHAAQPRPTAARSRTPRPPSVVWRTTEASWYGPGDYGHRTACGEAMTTTLVGVAHRSLPCGTLVRFRWGGRTVTAPVVDRGPYVSGRLWDMTAGLCALLHHCYTGPISWQVI
ncbi:MAG: RlpA-like double-psi beta-barrel domain-containing protein [Candidatus Limnocylindrales bacterium]